MPFLTKADLETHLYGDIIDEISRGDDTKVAKAISTAIGEAKSYLNKYNLATLFGDDFEDDHLRSKVKDIACWHLIKLCNPNINLELFKTAYEEALSWFKDIMKGLADPDGWPYKADDAATAIVDGSSVSYSSNRKRTNHY